MMKLVLAVVALTVDAAKVRTTVQREDPCPKGLTNRFPDSLPKKIVLVDDEKGGKAMNPMDSVFDLDKLREGLAKDPEWKIGMPWLLKATFSSDSQVDRTFGFASGDTGGFLRITVPAGVQDKDIQTTGKVEISGADAEFQYKHPALWTSGKIVMSDICLAPRSCDNFECPKHMKTKGTGLFGFSEARCCEMRMCADLEGACLPESMYSKAANFSEKKGYDNSTCCSPRYCPSDLCKDETKWVSKGDVVLGSTKEECCERLECATYTCSNPALMTKSPNYNEDGTPRYGSTDDECCAGKYCKGFDCQPTKDFGLKPGAANILGNSRDVCCDVKKCDTFECPNNTKWKSNPAAVVGSTLEQCCTKILCSSYTCSNNTLQKKPGQGTMLGSSDEECCEKKFCSSWSCSDATKWVHLSNQHGATNLDRRGFSDEECCDQKFCLAETCDPSTQWKAKEGLDKIQGSTKEQCCEKIYCDDFQCDTDVNNTGVGTQWYKRVDTNIYKWQGSTNEECCMPIFCSQYTTSHPTRWTRKKDAGAKGSTDAECYDPLLCSDYCCDKQAGLEHRPNAEHHQGSTDEECCVKSG